MFEDLPDGVEELVIQPVVIPRRYHATARLIEFYIVFGFARQDREGHFHPYVRRTTDQVHLPDCFRVVQPPRGGRPGVPGYWPTFIDSAIAAGELELNVVPSRTIAPFTTRFRMELPRELAYVGWDVRQADALWQRLLEPSARDTTAATLRFRRTSGRVRLAGLVPPPDRKPTDEIDPAIFSELTANPWSASDLRPNYRIESIETRTVAKDIETYIASKAANTASDPVDLLLAAEDDEDFYKFVQQRDGPDGEFTVLFQALRRTDDLKFQQIVLPTLRTTDAFKLKVSQLASWRREFLLVGSRSEILRQSRFVDAARNRAPVPPPALPSPNPRVRPTSDGVTTAAKATSLDFEQQVARLRQHPGLMRRLYLTVRCVAEWDAAANPKIDGGKIGLSIKIDPKECPFACLEAMTLFDLDCAERYFRPAPASDPGSQNRFYGPDFEKAKVHFRRFHALSPSLYQVSQEEPALAMARAAQGATDASQPAEERRNADPDSEGASVLNDALHRVNAVNFFHRAYNANGVDAPYATTFVERTSRDLKRLTAFNEHMERYLIATGRKSGTIRNVALAQPAAPPDPGGCPELYCAENLMMGYSIFVRDTTKSGGREPWRSLNRRVVELSFENDPAALLRFEEEGFVATSIIAPPRPQVGRVASFDNDKIGYDLFGPNNTYTAGHTVPIKYANLPNDPTQTTYVNPLRIFDAPDETKPLHVGDVALIALMGSPSKDGKPRPADEVFVHPVLLAKFGNNDALTECFKDQTYTPFGWATILECQNVTPTKAMPDGEPIRPKTWRAPILFAPEVTRLVDYLGGPIEPSKPLGIDPDKTRFRHFTAEVRDRQFAHALGESGPAATVDEKAESTAQVATNLGPINQVVLAHVGKRPVRSLALPDVDVALQNSGERIEPLRANGFAAAPAACYELPSVNLTAVRGFVSEVGFLLVLNIQKDEPPGEQKHLFQVVTPEPLHTERWFATRKLEVFRGGKSETIGELVCNAALVPRGLNSATILARGTFKDPVNLKGVEVTSLEIAPAGSQLSDGGMPLRLTLALQKVDGGFAEVHYPLDLKLPADPAGRFLHPTETRTERRGEYIEVIAENPGAVILPDGWPQRMLATLVRKPRDDRGVLRFPDGSEFEANAKKDLAAPSTGFFPVLKPYDTVTKRWGEAEIQTPTIQEPLRILGEVARVEADRIELTDVGGQTWTIRDVASRALGLPMGKLDFSVRTLRDLVAGEWLVVDCQMDGAGASKRDLLVVRVGAAAPKAKARALLRGRIKAPPVRPVTKAASGTVDYTPSAYRSVFGRELTIWSDSGSTADGHVTTASCERFLVAETLAQYVPPDEMKPTATAGRGIIRRAVLTNRVAEESSGASQPKHVVVSELITRWSNWAVGLEQPGAADLPRESQRPGVEEPPKTHYKIAMKRPGADWPFGPWPFDRASWLLPPLRFMHTYLFCVRRVDLAGNHLYEEDPLPVAEPVGLSPFWTTLESLGGGGGEAAFRRANLPLAPIVAFTPQEQFPSLPPPQADPPGVPPPLTKAPSGKGEEYDPSPFAHHFMYLPAARREPLLVLLSDALGELAPYSADAHLELLPPAIDVETMLLHGLLDRNQAAEAIALIQWHERYLDLPRQSRVLGRLLDGQVNYLPDPDASQLRVTVSSPMTDGDGVSKPAVASFFADPMAPTGGPWWPNVAWLRLVLQAAARRRLEGAAALQLPDPSTHVSTVGVAISVYLPAGATGVATLAVRPPRLDPNQSVTSIEHQRMVRDHGSESRTVRLVHATNGPLIRPCWDLLAEPPRDIAAPPTGLRDLEGPLKLDKTTTGACSIWAGWNDCWDEGDLSDQHEPAQAVVEVDANGNAAEAVLVSGGFGFKSQAVALFDKPGRPFRAPTFRARFSCGQLQELEVVDPGLGCDVMFRVVVFSPPLFCHPAPRAAYAQAWHDEKGVLLLRYLDRGANLGPSYNIDVFAEQSQLPRLAFTFAGGSVSAVRLVDKGRGPFSRDLRVKIIRRPPFYRVAEASFTAIDAQGRIAGVQVDEGGGWYVLPPHCRAVDTEGEGYGAVLSARLDERGGVVGVDVVCGGRGYTMATRGYDLRLMSPVNDVQAIPTTGQSSIIVAAVQNKLHFRVFHRAGYPSKVTDETELTKSLGGIEALKMAGRIENVRRLLEGLWPPHVLTESEKAQVITAVTSLVDHMATRIVFYNELAEIPEQAIAEPTRKDDGKLTFRFQHPLPDPRGRSVDYYAKGLSRFRQYLRAAWDRPDEPDPEVASGGPRDVRRHHPRTSPPRNVEILSHIRPVKPDVAYLMPAFAWKVRTPKDKSGVDPLSFFTGRLQGRIVVRRESRIRVYLRRPWHTSGPEQLAVVIPPAVLNTTLSTSQPTLLNTDGGAFNPLTTSDAGAEPGFQAEPLDGYAIGDDQREFATRWGFDPAWSESALPPLSLDHIRAPRRSTIYDHAAPADGPPSPVTFHRPVWVALLDVEYDGAKDRWFADIQVDISGPDPMLQPREWLQTEPIIRLGLARYQAHGLPGRCLSPIVVADPYKMLGRREIDVERHGERRFTLRLSGEFDRPLAGRRLPRREVYVRLEARDLALPDEVVQYLPPRSASNTSSPTSDACAQHVLAWDEKNKSYVATVEYDPDVWGSATHFEGRPSMATLAVVEHEIYRAPESRGDAADVEFVMIDGERCGRKLIFSSTFHVGPAEAKP